MSRLPVGSGQFPDAGPPTKMQAAIISYAYSLLQGGTPEQAEAAARARVRGLGGGATELTPGELVRISINARAAILAGSYLGNNLTDEAQAELYAQGTGSGGPIRYMFHFETVDASGNSHWHTATVTAPMGETAENMRLKAEVLGQQMADSLDKYRGHTFAGIGTGLLMT